MVQATFLTLLVSRLDNSLIINSRLPGYVNLTTSPFLATFQVQYIRLLCLGVAACDSAAQHTHLQRSAHLDWNIHSIVRCCHGMFAV